VPIYLASLGSMKSLPRSRRELASIQMKNARAARGTFAWCEKDACHLIQGIRRHKITQLL